ncbi:MAG: hypothetical protein ACOZHQ_12215 [Thermodesulfobacteriota bacterium]
MPALRILNPNKTFIDLAEQYLLAKMLFVENEARCEALVSSATIWAANQAKNDPAELKRVPLALEEMPGLKPEERAMLTLEILDQASYQAVQPLLSPLGGFGSIAKSCMAKPFTDKEAKERVTKGEITGNVIRHILYMAQHRPEDVSVNKAVYLCEKDLELGEAASGLVGISRRAIWDSWKTYKPVSHLWGAVSIWESVCDPDHPFSWFQLHKLFFPFLNVAKWVQDKVTTLYPRGKADPILDVASIYTLPGELSYESFDAPILISHDSP